MNTVLGRVGRYSCIGMFGLGLLFGQHDLLAAVDVQPLNVTRGSGSVAPGASLAVTWQIRNNGTTAAATSQSQVRITSSSSSWGSSGNNVGSAVATGTIAAGATINQNTTVTVPSLAPGTYYVWVIADNTSVLTQSNVNNDYAVSASFTITGGTVDVQPLNVTRSPSSVAPGDSLSVSWQIRNNGSASAATSQSQVRITSSSSSWGSSGNNVGSAVATGTIAAGATINQNRTVTVPSLAPGTYYVWVVADNTSVLSQSNTGNDFAVSSSFTVTAPTTVDVQPLNVTRSPSSVAPGDSLSVSWQIRNNGTASAATSQSQVRITTSSSSWGNSGNNVGSAVATGTIGAGATINQSKAVTVPALSPGTYYVWVIADNTSVLSQSDVNNDYAVSASFTVTGTVDVQPLNVTRGSSSVAPGASLAVNWQIRNNGSSSAATSQSQVRITSSSSSYGNPANNVGSAVATGAIAAGATINQNTTVTVPALAPGTYYVWVIADNTSLLTQTDVNNDYAVSASFTVTGGLSIVGVSPTSMPASGVNQTLTIDGNNFDPAATLTFDPPTGGNIDSTEAKFTSKTSTRLVYQINNANDIGTWQVRVNNPGGVSSDWVNFTVSAGTPVISSVTPPSMPPSGANQTLTIDGSNFDPTATLTFDPPTGGNIDSAEAKFTSKTTTRLVYQLNNGNDVGGWLVRVNNPGGLSSDWANFTVTPAPVSPVLSVSPANPSSQPATAGSISFSVSNTGGGAMSYTASVTGGTSWLHIISGASGGNSGTIVVSYDANPGAQRSGTVVVTASGASGSPTALTVFQSASGAMTVMLPNAINYIRQIHDSDMHPTFNSSAACGPSSAVMILTYYNRLARHPMIGQSGQNNDFSWYVAPIDQNGNPSSTAYSYMNFTFVIGTRDVPVGNGGMMNYGAHGYLCQDNQADPQTYNVRALEYFWKHGLWAFLDYSPTVEEVRSEIDAGRPVFLSTRYSLEGHHIMVIRGYEPSVLNPGDGTESSHLASRLRAADPWVRVSGEDRHDISYSWAELHYANDQKYMIRSIAPIVANARVRATGAFPGNVREQPSVSANPAGAVRTEGELGTIVFDSQKNSVFWNADGYAWVKVRWDVDQVVGWSAIGSGSSLWIEPYSSGGGGSGGGAASPIITSAERTGTTFGLSVPAQVGFECVLECKNSASDANWTPVHTNSGSIGQIGLTDTGAVAPSKIYRVRVQ